MRTILTSITSSSLACGLVASVVACGGRSDPATPPDSGEAGPILSPDAGGGRPGQAVVLGDAGQDVVEVDDASIPDVAAVEAGPPQAFVRVANFTPDAPAAGYDVCLASTGTTSWIGPIFAQSFSTGIGAAGAAGVQFPMVTQYVAVPPDTYDLQLVAAGATDCTSGVIPTTMGLPTLTAGANATFAVVGDVHPTQFDSIQKVTAFLDDSTIASGSVAVRAINAAPSIAYVDVTASASGTTLWALTNVPFGAASAMLANADGPGSDSNGYATLAPASGIQLVAQTSGAARQIATGSNASLPAGAVVTLAVINGENSGPPPQLMMCTDNGAPVNGLSPCVVF